MHPFSHIIRRTKWEDMHEKAKTLPGRDGVGATTATRYVHVDQSYEGAHRVLRNNMEDETDRLLKTRWAIINVWRPISAIKMEPFGMCDWTTIHESDLVAVEAVLPPQGSNTFENVSRGGFSIWACKSNTSHRWYYISDMTPDEVHFVKCFDSKKDGRARCSPHSSFVNPKTKDVPAARESIEVRCLVFWEDETAE